MKSGDIEELGAGDQGLMFGYATDETQEFLPLSYVLATKLLLKLKELRVNKTISWLKPDAKSQITMKYKIDSKGKLEPLYVDYALISTQHEKGTSLATIRETIKNQVMLEVIDSKYITKDTKFLINPSKSFVVGGPLGDSGVTGRKIICDTYGG